MRILLAGQTYGPANGPGAFLAALAGGLASAGDQVVVIAPADVRRTSARDVGGVRLVAVRACSLAPLYPEVRVAIAPRRPALDLIDASCPDVVHIQDHFPLCRCVARACEARGLPLVATNHFVPENIVPHVPLIARSTAARRAAERLMWRLVARVFAHADVVTTPTETAAARLRPCLGAAPLRAISCGVDRTRFVPLDDRAAIRRSLGFGPRDRVLCYVGRLDVEKRVDLLLRAVAALPRGDVKLLIAGDGREAAALRRLARALAVDARVVFTGFVSPARVVELLGAADCFAMPGDVEVQSIATLEAMAAGLPVLAARAGALPELVEDRVNGALFRASDVLDAARCIEDLLDAAERWPEMARASRLRAAKHDLRYTVDAYRTLYAELVRGRTSS